MARSLNVPAATRFAFAKANKYLKKGIPMTIHPPRVVEQIDRGSRRVVVGGRYRDSEVRLTIIETKIGKFWKRRLARVEGEITVHPLIRSSLVWTFFAVLLARHRFRGLPLDTEIWREGREKVLFAFDVTKDGPRPARPKIKKLKTVDGKVCLIQWAISTQTIRIADGEFPQCSCRLFDPCKARYIRFKEDVDTRQHRDDQIYVASVSGYDNGYLNLATGFLKRNGDNDFDDDDFDGL